MIELAKLDKKRIPLNDGGLVNWLMFLKSEDKSNGEALTMKEPMLKKAMDTLEFLSQDAAARMAYDARMKALSDENLRIESAVEFGKSKEKTLTAIKLLEMGLDVGAVSEVTGLTEESIRALRPLQQ